MEISGNFWLMDNLGMKLANSGKSAYFSIWYMETAD
jgi:hypothetical protein